MRLIDADELIKDLTYDICGKPLHGNHKTNYANIRASVLAQKTIDVENIPIVNEIKKQINRLLYLENIYLEVTKITGYKPEEIIDLFKNGYDLINTNINRR